MSRLKDGLKGPEERNWAACMNTLTNRAPISEIAKLNDDEGWVLPKIWKTGLKTLRKEKPVEERLRLLNRTGVLDVESLSMEDHYDVSDPMEIIERERCGVRKETFRLGDFEPEATQRFSEVQEKIREMLHTKHVGPTDWVWFILQTLDRLDIQVDEEYHVQDPSIPRPNSLIIRDMVQAFASMAMFFHSLDATTQVSMFIQSDKCAEFRNSLLFKPRERGKTKPDRRTRTSYILRKPEFWKEWDELIKKGHPADIYPMDWSIAVRPIVAKLYRAGFIEPYHAENDAEVVVGAAIAKKEPHRPDKLDFFINYNNPHICFSSTPRPGSIQPDKWPKLLPLAQKFGSKNPDARFALLRLWSAPHFYPLMVGDQNKHHTSFLDSRGRAWIWNFAPKDMLASESMAHHIVATRLKFLRKQLGDRVDYCGDLILVMSGNSADLLKYFTAVTFAMQTRPWLREVDLWKSFINVELDVLEGLDPF